MYETDSLVPLSVLARRLRVKSAWLRGEAEAERLPHLRAGDTFLFHEPTVRRVLANRAAKGEGVRE